MRCAGAPASQPPCTLLSLDFRPLPFLFSLLFRPSLAHASLLPSQLYPLPLPSVSVLHLDTSSPHTLHSGLLPSCLDAREVMSRRRSSKHFPATRRNQKKSKFALLRLRRPFPTPITIPDSLSCSTQSFSSSLGTRCTQTFTVTLPSYCHTINWITD